MVGDGDDLVGLFEIAAIAGVTPAAVANWRARHPDFPPAISELRSGPVFQRDQVRKWLKKRRIRMATVICTINLKGGVGKSTTTVAVGEFMAHAFRKRVLIIDLDPQTNATTMLIGEEKWEALNKSGNTLAQLFKDALTEDPAAHKFDLNQTLQRNVSNVRDVQTLDLVPSSLDLIDVQDRLATMPSGRFYSNNPTEVLHRALKPVLDDYDYVLIDCPPNLGLITLNGLRIADGYIIPTIPDVLSTYGIPQIVTRIKSFADNIREPIVPYGIVVTKYQSNSSLHNRTLRQLRDDREKYPHVFSTVVPQSNAMAESAEFVAVNTLKQKYDYGNRYDTLFALTQEIMKVVEA
ncbi:MAG: AAA family ATPase [Phycisphaeraceae bacterium]|nr:AAA family ATPase [Phycisphaeraceae bacterium]